MRRLLVIATLLAASSASAQSQFDFIQVDNVRAPNLTGTSGFNRLSCKSNENHTIEVKISGLTQSTYFWRWIQYPRGLPNPCPVDANDATVGQHVIVPNGTQPDGAPYEQVNTDTSGSIIDETKTLSTQQLVGLCDQQVNRQVNVCVQLFKLQNDITPANDGSQGGFFEMDYDTVLPAPPTVSSISADDSSITFNFATPDNPQNETFTFVVQFRKCAATTTTTGEGEGASLFGTDAGQALTAGEGEGEGEGGTTTSLCNATGDFAESTSADPKVTLTGLASDQQIEFRALLRDSLGNESSPTALALAKTIPDLGPLDVYNGAGSTISCAPSCGTSTSTTDAGTLTDAGAFLFVVALTKRGRKTLGKIAKKGASAFLGLGVFVALLTSTNARADLGQMTVGMSVSPYKPDLDSEKLGNGKVFPMYSCIFGGKTQTQIGGAIDEHVFDDFGSLQLSFGLDLSQAQGFAQDTSELITHTCGAATKSAVQLTMLNMRPGVTYRFDPALDAWGFPLVPYGRLGFVGTGYMFTKNGNFDETNPKVNPVGLRYGWEGALGLMLALDFIESAARGVVNATDRPGLRIVSDNVDMALPDSTRRARANGTFDHTFLFVEGAYQSINDFGQRGFVFSNQDTLFNTKLPILWRIGIAVELL